MRTVAIFLVVAMTATGIYDFVIVVKKNNSYLVLDMNDPVTDWIAENTTCEDLILSPCYALTEVVMGGAMLYYGWGYYAWSAGYDTYSREVEVKCMYESKTPEELKRRVEANNIRYIIVDHDVRSSETYDVREDVIESTYEVVFLYNTEEGLLKIFDTRKVINMDE